MFWYTVKGKLKVLSVTFISFVRNLFTPNIYQIITKWNYSHFHEKSRLLQYRINIFEKKVYGIKVWVLGFIFGNASQSHSKIRSPETGITSFQLNLNIVWYIIVISF